MGALRLLIATNGAATVAAAVVLFLDPGLIASAAGIATAPTPRLVWNLLAAAELGLAAMCLLSLSSGAEVLGLVTIALIVFHGASAAAGVMSLMQAFHGVVLANVVVRIAMIGLLAWLGFRKPEKPSRR